MLLTIVTPTILRETLARTCASIDRQGFADWEHLVMIDRPAESFSLQPLMDERRKFIFCQAAHNDYGNSCRRKAYELAQGEYIFCIDDDDFLMPGALELIAQAIHRKNPRWLVFPASVHGERWLKLPPRSGATVNCQIVHRAGPMFPAVKDYAADGILIDELMRESEPYVLDCPGELVVVEKSNYGGA
jgi:glycosyltransferase involved in cell wall biosynthesis